MSRSTEQSFTVRKPVPTDVEFIMKTWMRTLADEYRKVPSAIYYASMQQLLLGLVRSADCRVVTVSSDPNFIVGFVVGKHDPDTKSMVVHFAMVRGAFRQLGLARSALADMGWQEGVDDLVCTFWHKYLGKFKRDDMYYNPFLLYKV